MSATLISNHTLPSGVLSQIDSKGLTRSIWGESLSSKDHFIFFYRIVSETIDSLVEGTYTNFDAHTTSNCCHGLSILVRELILSTQSFSLHALKKEVISTLKSQKIENYCHFEEQLIETLPAELIDLASLYVLTLISETDPIRGRRTTPTQLKKKGKLGTKFCEKIVKRLQRTFSNYVAESYQSFFEESDKKKWISTSTLQDWVKYIESPFLRKDRKGVKYASCLYSMQVSLCYLAHTHTTIALVSDLMDPLTQTIKRRYIRFLKNCGNGELSLIDEREVNQSKNEPIIVFGGYAFSKELDIKNLSYKMEPWIYQFTSLILACDTQYPQFPEVADDPNFDSSPIYPNEANLKEMIDIHSKIEGLSAEDPSLFCLSHIFVSNSKVILNAIENIHSHDLAPCYIPCTATSKYLQMTYHNYTAS